MYMEILTDFSFEKLFSLGVVHFSKKCKLQEKAMNQVLDDWVTQK